MPYFSLGLVAVIALLGVVVAVRPDVMEAWRRDRDQERQRRRGAWWL